MNRTAAEPVAKPERGKHQAVEAIASGESKCIGKQISAVRRPRSVTLDSDDKRLPSSMWPIEGE